MSKRVNRNMKVLLVIDHLGSGGAQRQIVELACGLKRRGDMVEMFVYHLQHDFFRHQIDEMGIPVHQYAKGNGFSFGVIRKLRSLLRSDKYDVVLSYLSDANIYTEVSRMLLNTPVLVVSERSSHLDDKCWPIDSAKRLLHATADHVVANSRTHRDWLKCKPWLTRKVSCIYNGVDTQKFRYAPTKPKSIANMRLIGIGRVGPEKNLISLVKALKLLFETTSIAPHVDWVGAHQSIDGTDAYFREVKAMLESVPEIHNKWRWHGVRADIHDLLPEYQALIHPSLYEGLPNVVCEALAVGKPVLASSVCDHPVLVGNNERGFLFDADNPRSICSAIEKLGSLDEHDWRVMARNAREFAVNNLGIEKMVSAHRELFIELLAAQKTSSMAPMS